MKETHPSNILVRAPNWIGDAVMGTPALMDLRKAYPSANITLWARPAVAELLKGHPSINEILVYDYRGKHGGMFGKAALIQTLRKGNFELAILFQNAFEAAILTLLAGIAERVGYATDGRKWLLSKSIEAPIKKGAVHLVQYYQGLIRDMTEIQTDRIPNLVVDKEDQERIDQRFPELVMTDGDYLIGVNPGSIYGTAKRWLPERFAEAADHLVRKFREDLLPGKRIRIVLVGSQGEESLGQYIADCMKECPIVLSGKTTLRELMGIIKRCSIFLTNDTGPMHIANAFNVPLAAVFGPTDPDDTAPYNNRQALVRTPVNCAPCFLRHCPIDHRCMTGVSVQQVYQVALTQYEAALALREQAGMN